MVFECSTGCVRERKRYQKTINNDINIHQELIQKTMKQTFGFGGQQIQQIRPIGRPRVEKVLGNSLRRVRRVRFAAEGSLLMN